MSDDRTQFGLSNLRRGIEGKTDELSSDANPRSVSGSDVDRNRPYTYETDDYDRTEAPKDDMRKYWRQFETTPIVRKPITAFASRVVEPGYYIEAENLTSDEIRELGNWLESCSIIEGQPGRDFRELIKKAIIQREVRGTALVEKAPHEDDTDVVAGLKLINPETIEAVTRPNKAILMKPEDINEFEGAPTARSGGAAAWLQDMLETDQTWFGKSYNDDGDTKIGFRRDEIIPLTRDADVGEVFGTSRLEAVSNRIEGIKQKLDDQDEAIASKAYPLWLFMFGDPESEEGVWDSDEIKSFMTDHNMDNFRPGMKQGVRGDVSVETVSGEVADIAEYLEFDIQWIMASMPMPMFLLGSFGSSLAGAQFQGVAQQQDIIRQIEDARTEIENEFTPLVREIAIQKGIDEDRAKDIDLRFGNPGGPDPEVKRSQQTIRYISDAGDAEDPQPTGIMPQQMPGAGQMQPTGDSGNVSPRSGDQSNPQTSEEPRPDRSDSEQIDGRYANLWQTNTAELQHGIEPDTAQIDGLSSVISDILVTVRDRTLDRVESKYASTPTVAASEFENIANTSLNRALRSAEIRSASKEYITEAIDSIDDEHRSSTDRLRDRERVNYFAQNVRNAVRDAGEELLRQMRTLIRDAVISGDSWTNARERVMSVYDTDSIEQRADLIAHMELTNAVETTKLHVFESHPDIVGIRVSNPDASTTLTQSVDGATAYFDRENDIVTQLTEQVNTSHLREGFDPLPRTPPYHFGDTTTLEPIYDQSADGGA